MTKIDSQHYNHEGYDILLEFSDRCGWYIKSPIPYLTFDSLKKARVAVDLWRKGNGNIKTWFASAWLLAINPKNYNGVYGRLTKKRLALRKKLLK